MFDTFLSKEVFWPEFFFLMIFHAN